ncbi:DUF4249 domain-containing protein [Microvirga sp. STS02]|uniref:DUF4249 domain-containing protein n=1 Tax=Hymenobacter negativus TaxID=2795026 RepID=UPI0018DBDDFE|nr:MULTISPECIES: DUF4249 domain-containing protein [Bacteria]MBH8571065.1 DUF4249 domain-containing protein [Hymenobacter negativus]MBR7210802.1 DUF4249 domain-containing protein [Microvirga sp. STS02]
MKTPTRSLRFLAAAATVLLAASCQKVITLDLKESAPRLSIEGNLADDGQPCTVLLGRSVSYTETNTFPAVSGAKVTLSDDAGGLEALAETSTPGQYRGRTVLGQPGRRYTLRVEVEGQAYVAASTLPSPVVPLAGLRAQKAPIGTSIQALPDYLDPAGTRNYYLFRQYRNGRLNPNIYLQNDEFTDGKANVRGLGTGGGGSRGTDADKLVAGDSLRVEMQNVDADVYEYFRTLNLTLQGGGMATASPANPKSNFSGDVLGYFSAHSVRRRTILVPAL